MDYKIGDTVMYGRAGVCKIKDIKDENFFGTKSEKYFILIPVYDTKNVIYAPVNSDEDKLRKLLSQEEVHELISAMPDETLLDNTNETQRRAECYEILKNGSHMDLIKLIKTLYALKEEKIQSGKKFASTDERIMNDAEKQLYEELALVLDIEPEEVLPFIMGEINKNNKY